MLRLFSFVESAISDPVRSLGFLPTGNLWCQNTMKYYIAYH